MVARPVYAAIGTEDILNTLRKEHKKVGDCFDEFLLANGAVEKEASVKRALFALALQARLEQELLLDVLYVEDKELVEQTLEEHRLMAILISELEVMSAQSPRFQARFMVLASLADNHYHEEETFVLPILEDCEFDRLALSAEFLRRRDELAQRLSRPSDILKSKQPMQQAV